jgi:hypothetical protein
MPFELTRREFVLVNVTAGIGLLTHVPITAGLSHEEANTLLAVARTMFPHDNAGDDPFKHAVNAINDECLQDPQVCRTITRGISALNRCCPGGFATADRRHRVTSLKTMIDSRFFLTVYSQTLTSLYAKPCMWEMFSHSPPTV